MKIRKLAALAAVGLASVALLAACSSKGSSTSSTKSQTITVATSADSNPYEYTNSKGQLQGFEIDLLKKIDADLPQYNFKFTTTQDSSILLALDGGHAQIAANNFGKTPERETKYLFTYPELEGVNAIFSSTKNPITTVAGLFGKTTEIPTGSNYGAIMEAWNKSNSSKQIKISYSQNSLTDRLQEISTGKIDFLFADKKAAENLLKEHSITGVTDKIPTDLKTYPQFKTYSYFILPSNQKTLQAAMNKELKKFAQDGTLKSLSEKYFGDNQVPEASQYN
ncbi:MAG: transporter substrate-binding domain-containing protein [Streptococcaceae bacterium]|jgi:polar amino acid transport system substrate-binding protein|nr:transporter substrate-binding domain-containing protein [Streptococcaceae bacterium]